MRHATWCTVCSNLPQPSSALHKATIIKASAAGLLRKLHQRFTGANSTHHHTNLLPCPMSAHSPCNQQLHVVQLQTLLWCMVQASAQQRPTVASLLAHHTGHDTAAATGPIKVAKSLSKCGATQADTAPNKPKQCMHWLLRGHHAQRRNSNTQHL
jgi:hypothetical protein